MNYPKTLINLIDQFKTLPGVGPKSAERMALYVLKSDSDTMKKFTEAVTEVKQKITYCRQCFNFSERELCNICESFSRNREIICVVENPNDIHALEKTGKYNGLYHVLLGKISPLDGVRPEHLKIKELVARVEKQQPREIILATSADIEGDATALYLAKLLGERGLKTTRIAYGIPVGSSLEFADEMTLSRSIEGRHAFQK